MAVDVPTIGRVWKTPFGFCRVVGFRVGGKLVRLTRLEPDAETVKSFFVEASDFDGYGWYPIGDDDDPWIALTESAAINRVPPPEKP
jgi:hypothetical protein